MRAMLSMCTGILCYARLFPRSVSDLHEHGSAAWKNVNRKAIFETRHRVLLLLLLKRYGRDLDAHD